MEIKAKSVKQKRSQTSEFIIAVCIILIVNVIASFFYLRIDLTADKRYTLRPITKEILKQADEPVYIKVYLSGELPSGFVRLENSVKELLEEFKIYQKNIHFEFIDIYKIENEKLRNELIKELVEKGMQPTQLEVKTKEGVNRRLIFPTAEVSVSGKFTAVKLLVEQYSRSSDETLNNSIQNIELQFISAIRSLFDTDRKSIAIVDGHQELEAIRTVSIAYDLTEFYNVKRIRFENDPAALLAYDSLTKDIKPLYDLLIIAQPKTAFSEEAKYGIDQYVMRGGRILWLLDAASASLDSLRGQEEIVSQYYPLNLEDLLFSYGVRIQPNIVLDLNGAGVPVVTGYMGGQPTTEFMPLVYLPLLNPLASNPYHPICKGVGLIRAEFISTIDTIKNPIAKTLLLTTSPYSKRVSIPSMVSLDILKDRLNPRLFKDGPQPVAVLLEGDFNSAYKRRIPQSEAVQFLPFVSKGIDNKMIVISDGDIIKNDLHYSQDYPMPLGFDQYSKQMYDNKAFLFNCVHYLCGENAWMDLKAREVKMRLLDKTRLAEERFKWQLITLVFPNLLIIVCGIGFYTYRKRKYGQKNK